MPSKCSQCKALTFTTAFSAGESCGVACPKLKTGADSIGLAEENVGEPRLSGDARLGANPSKNPLFWGLGTAAEGVAAEEEAAAPQVVHCAANGRWRASLAGTVWLTAGAEEAGRPKLKPPVGAAAAEPEIATRRS